MPNTKENILKRYSENSLKLHGEVLQMQVDENMLIETKGGRDYFYATSWETIDLLQKVNVIYTTDKKEKIIYQVYALIDMEKNPSQDYAEILAEWLDPAMIEQHILDNLGLFGKYTEYKSIFLPKIANPENIEKMLFKLLGHGQTGVIRVKGINLIAVKIGEKILEEKTVDMALLFNPYTGEISLAEINHEKKYCKDIRKSKRYSNIVLEALDQYASYDWLRRNDI